MICPKCGERIPDDSVFCQECGYKLESDRKKRCEICGTYNDWDAMFCERCGQPLEDEVTPNGLIDKECTYDEYLENDEAARKRQIVEIEEDDE